MSSCGLLENSIVVKHGGETPLLSIGIDIDINRWYPNISR